MSAVAAPWTPDHRLLVPGPRLRMKLMSFNIQVGLNTQHYGHYLTRSWRHALPGTNMHRTLDPIADLMAQYDFVAVQEGDAGSLRTGFRNQIEYLARRAGFAHWGMAVTRNIHPVARHCLGFLSRYQPFDVGHHALPSQIPGRRAMQVALGPEAGNLQLLLTHMSLGRAAQLRQLDYLGGLVKPGNPAVLMGDLNCDSQLLRDHPALRKAGLLTPSASPATFPSWKPARGIDHILVSEDIALHSLEALPHRLSDHLPLSAEISLAVA